MCSAVTVVKSRTATNERTIREFRLSAGGLQVGEPLADFEGVLTACRAMPARRR